MATRQLIIDEDIVLRELELNDVDSIFNTIVNERSYLDEWLPFVEITKEISFTQMFVENYLDSDKSDLTCVVIYKQQFAGIIGLKDTDFDNKKTEIGYWLSESFQHKGIITRSAKIFIDYVFNEMELNRVQLKAATENYKSQAVAKRLGFTQEGIERDGELHNRGFVDLMVFGLLKRDWLNQ